MPLSELARSRLAALGRKGSLPLRPHRLPGERPICRLCSEPCPGRRYNWCSDECFDAYSLATDSAVLRRWTFERDKGICAECGLDCMALRKTAECMSERYGSLEWAKARTAAMRATLRDNGFEADGFRCSLWDADHIEPLAEGGSWELSNVQTLCTPCHKRKTAAQAGRRAKQGRLIGRPTRIWTPEMVALIKGMK